MRHLCIAQDTCFPPLLEISPLRVYAIACRHDLEEAKIAARYTLILTYSPVSIDLQIEVLLEYQFPFFRRIQA